MPKPEQKYEPPEPLPMDDLIEEPDLRPLWAISQVVSGREDLKLDELEERIAALEKGHGRGR